MGDGLGGRQDGEEFSIIVELIISVLFMCFGIFMTVYAYNYIQPLIAKTYENDKIAEVSVESVPNPYLFNAYEAAMLFYHQDEC